MGKVNKTDREWQRELSPEEYRITRQKGTEPAFTGQYWNTKQHGTYVCRCCGAELFSSDTKYDSGCGWPTRPQHQPVCWALTLTAPGSPTWAPS